MNASYKIDFIHKVTACLVPNENSRTDGEYTALKWDRKICSSSHAQIGILAYTPRVTDMISF